MMITSVLYEELYVGPDQHPAAPACAWTEEDA